MLERKDRAGGERSCCWERIMLVEKNHVLVEHIIMVAKDHVGGGRC